jgi:2-C-methyl-D-erythritol 4-phosphate cytidylyltransferase
MTSADAPNDPVRLYGLVPCAGVGERAGVGAPKQYRSVAGRALVAHTLAELGRVARLTATLVVLAPQDQRFERHAAAFSGWVCRDGGASRAQTVTNGLAELARRGARTTDWVLVHDAARCLVRAQWIDALIDACLDDPVGGLLAVPVADTLKSAHDGRVSATVERETMWLAQTPQMFRLGPLRQALSAAGSDVTDEAGAMQALGLAPRLIAGSLENLKITWPEDFELAERLLRTRT